MSDASEVLALAQLYSEMTHCTLEVALNDMVWRSNAVKMVAQVTPEPEPVAPVTVAETLRDFDRDEFFAAMRWAKPGKGYTAAELCLAFGMKFKPAMKAPGRLLTAAGWTQNGEKRICQDAKCRVFVKPLNGGN